MSETLTGLLVLTAVSLSGLALALAVYAVTGRFVIPRAERLRWRALRAADWRRAAWRAFTLTGLYVPREALPVHRSAGNPSPGAGEDPAR